MSNAAVAAPYAKALLDLAVAQGSLRSVRDQMEKVAALAAESKDLRMIFSNPTVAAKDQKAVLDALTKRLAVARTTRNFLFLLADKRRLPCLPDIVLEFQRLADEHIGVVRAEVHSSVQLSVTQMSRLKTTLGEMTGKTVIVNNLVDPNLLGGIEVRVGGKVYDASIRTRIEKIRESITLDI